jgi:hypothetical protein
MAAAQPFQSYPAMPYYPQHGGDSSELQNGGESWDTSSIQELDLRVEVPAGSSHVSLADIPPLSASLPFEIDLDVETSGREIERRYS